MSDKPKTIDDILAEMRSFGERCDHRPFSWQMVDGLFRRLADRIEAAVRREREAAEARQLNECVVVREEEASEWRKRIGNAAAMREALSDIAMQCLYVAEGISDESDYGRVTLMRIRDKARAALAAPARNCDRFRTVGAAHKAWRATDQERDFADWLFDPEGGAE